MTDSFQLHRNLLFTVAYEILGSAADAEDVVQDSWLRWDALDEQARARVRSPRAYLVQIATRQALNRKRALARRREEYVGPWLPEPLLTAPDVADDVELAESVSLAMLTVLETLDPTQRAVFVLREVFAVPYAEISEAVGKPPAAVRQIAHRARAHVAERRPRVRVSRAEQEAVITRFLAAVRGGDVDALMAVLAPDVVVIADGGGKVQAAFRPVSGPVKVRQLFEYLFRSVTGDVRMEPAWVNGELGVRFEHEGRVASAIGFVITDGLISRLFTIANPDKLDRLSGEVALSR